MKGWGEGEGGVDGEEGSRGLGLGGRWLGKRVEGRG